MDGGGTLWRGEVWLGLAASAHPRSSHVWVTTPCAGTGTGGDVGWHSRHDLLDVEVRTPVLLNARHMTHADDTHNHRWDTLPGLSCRGRADISG